jgi:MOSC domain-containing protein YiiM
VSTPGSLHELLSILPQRGTVRWIGLRPARQTPQISVAQVLARAHRGLEGDRFAGGGQSKRQVTLIQHEHLNAVASLLEREGVEPELLRRNLVVSGINLLALNRAYFRVGEAVLLGTGACHPCSRMEASLGPGGYNAMRGHGGITAQVIESGLIRTGDAVELVRVMEPQGKVGRRE